jgi:CHAT domain-containing protein
MGVLLGNSGQLKSAVDYYMKYAELIRREHGATHLLMSDAYNYLGVMYRHMGESDLALDYYKKSVEIAERYTTEERTAIAPRFRSVAPVYNNIGTVYHHRGDHDNALAYTLKALHLYENDKSANKISLAAILSSLGTTYTKLDQPRVALLYKQKALEIFTEEYGAEHGRVATELKNIGESFFELKEYTKAEDHFKRSLEMNLAVHGQHHANTAEAYAKVASSEEVKGNLTLALELIQKSIQCLVSGFTSNDIDDNPDIDALCNVKIHLIDKLAIKGDLLMKAFQENRNQELLGAAHGTYSRAVDFSEIVRNDLLDIRSKAFLAENSKSLFEKSIRTALMLHQNAGDTKYIAFAFATMEKNKSRLLLESIQNSKVKSTGADDASLFNTENGLQSQIAFLEEQILDEKIKAGPDSVRINQYESRLFEARRELESFQRTLEKENPKYYQAKYLKPDIGLPVVQRSLRKNELLLEFFAGSDALYIFYATAEKSGVITETTGVLKKASELINGVRGRNTKIYGEAAYPLYAGLVGRAIDAAGMKEKITIIPDGILSYLPFELLLTSPPGTKKMKDYDYAIRKHNFSYHLSAALMKNRFSNEVTGKTTQFAGFAPVFAGTTVASRGLPGNIPYAQSEVKEIASTFPGSVYVGDEATESNFRQHAGSAELLHLATHASLDQNANLSRLYFADADSTDDGLLHAYEVYNLDLNAKLVTLSACNTGAGAYKEGEGVMSLSRAFAYAGCESMLTSLWPSQDQTTADIMAAFYRNLAKGDSKDEALRQAKLDFLSGSDNIKSDPFYWAGFILIGDTEPVKRNSSIYIVLFGGVVAALLGFSAFQILRRRRQKITI